MQETLARRGAPCAQTGFCRDRKYRWDSKGDRFKVSSTLVLGRSKVAFSLNHMLPVNLQASWNSYQYSRTFKRLVLQPSQVTVINLLLLYNRGYTGDSLLNVKVVSGNAQYLNVCFRTLFWGHAAWHVGSYFPNPCPLQWNHGLLITGPTGKSLRILTQ